MTTTNTFVGISESQRVSSRVLKPPGGGSSISFGEEDDLHRIVKAKNAPLQASPKNDDQSPKAETNGTATPPQSPKDNATATKENNSPSPATNGVAQVNGTVTNGTNGTTTSGSSTPNSSRVDTQSRLFGEEAVRQDVSSSGPRRVRDHYRSNIFTGDEKTSNPPKPANPVGNETPEPKTPEAKTPEQPQPQSQQKQRVPPGGFSTKLW